MEDHNAILPVMMYNVRNGLVIIGGQMAGNPPQPFVWGSVDFVLCFVNRLHLMLNQFVDNIDWVKEQIVAGRDPSDVMNELLSGRTPAPEWALKVLQEIEEAEREKLVVGYSTWLEELSDQVG